MLPSCQLSYFRTLILWDRYVENEQMVPFGIMVCYCLADPTGLPFKMSLINSTVLTLKRLVLLLFNVIRKAACCFRRKTRRNSGSLLPVTIASSAQTGPDSAGSSPVQRQFNQFSAHSTTASWQSWNTNQNSFGNPQFNPGENTAMNAQPADQPEENDDFFRDMMPHIKKQKRVSFLHLFYCVSNLPLLGGSKTRRSRL